MSKQANRKYDPAERRARYLASKSDPEKLAAHRIRNRKWAADFRKRTYSDPQKVAAFKSRQQWDRIKRRIEEDGDVIGADEFRTPDGLIYYAVAMLVMIKAGPAVKAAKKARRAKMKALREARRALNADFREKRRVRATEYTRNRRREIPRERILNALRCRLSSAVRRLGAKKCRRTAELLGCSIEDLKEHLKSQFAPGMDWSNFGRKKGIQCWEIDHIIPCASFDLTDPEQQKRCFHFTNLQPLWATENRKKSAKVDSPLTPAEAVAA